jgi:hypothetical protein
MPWLPIYADEEDSNAILTFLNSDAGVAFIVSAGPGTWIARDALDTIADHRACLWHVPSGPLPLLHRLAPTTNVDDPWAGWVGQTPAPGRTTPYFGPGHPGVIWWNIRIKSHGADTATPIGLSSFEWIGNRYSPAPRSTIQWWAGLRRFVRKQAMRIPRSGPLDGPRPEIWALPSALAKFRLGFPRDINP